MLPGVSLRTLPADQIAQAIDQGVALVMLTQVHYKSAAKHDMAAITQPGRMRRARDAWDLSHSAGAVDVDLNGVRPWPSAAPRHSNGGPGAPAWLYVARRHQAAFRSPLAGWMGHAAPFDFGDDYRPAEGMKAFLCGTPPMLFAAFAGGGGPVRWAGRGWRRWPPSRSGLLTLHRVGGVNAALVRPCPGHAARGGRARQPRRLRPRARLSDHAGDDRARSDRRLSYSDILRCGFTPLISASKTSGGPSTSCMTSWPAEAWRCADRFHPRSGDLNHSLPSLWPINPHYAPIGHDRKVAPLEREPTGDGWLQTSRR